MSDLPAPTLQAIPGPYVINGNGLAGFAVALNLRGMDFVLMGVDAESIERLWPWLQSIDFAKGRCPLDRSKGQEVVIGAKAGLTELAVPGMKFSVVTKPITKKTE